MANGLQAEALGNDACEQFVRLHRDAFLFGANEVPDLEDATREIERRLKRGAVVIGEQKFGVECDSTEMQRIYALARAYDVPVLMHWQFKMYNYGFERFHKMLAKFPEVKFVGHAQTWWANIDPNYTDQTVLYPKGPVTAGGLTDRYLSDYPNMYGDVSAGSGLNALTRDESFAREFLTRHREKLLFGSDCNDRDGGGSECLGAKIIATIRRLAADPQIERQLLYENAKRLFRL
jgi:predicted TIM-barrel fold metal-dependent hydrolase